jgi:hypothetical protein
MGPPVDQPSSKDDWLISVPPLADIDNRSPNLQGVCNVIAGIALSGRLLFVVLFRCHNEAQKALLEVLPTRSVRGCD